MLDGALPAPVAGGRVHGRIELRAGGSTANAALAVAQLGASAGGRRRRRCGDPGPVRGRPFAAQVRRGVAHARRRGAHRLRRRRRRHVDRRRSRGEPRLAPDDLPATLEAGAVLVSGYSLLQPGSEAAARAAFDRARTDWLAVDAASARLVATFGVDRFLEATATAGVLLANADEARTLTGLDAGDAARALARHYRRRLRQARPRRAIAASGEDVVHVEVQSVDRSDTLGAGDAFSGGFLLSLARGVDLAAAVPPAATRRRRHCSDA